MTKGHVDDPAFGYRFIADELEDHGFSAAENRVARLCCSQRIWSVFAKKRGLTRKAGPPAHDDHVRRDFSTPAPDQLWLTDISEHRTDEGKLYQCAIKDVYSNRIAGYSIEEPAGASLNATLIRGGDQQQVTITLGSSATRPRPEVPLQ